MPTKPKPFAAPAMTTPAQDTPSLLDRNVRLRNGCAVAAVACYALVNLLAWVTLRHLTTFTYDHANEILGGIRLLGVAIVGLYVAFCCYGAQARGWSGWVGALIAGGGVVLWFGLAVALLFQNVNNGFSTTNEPRVYDDRLPWLIGVAFVAAALALWALPKRTQAGRTPARQGV